MEQKPEPDSTRNLAITGGALFAELLRQAPG